MKKIFLSLFVILAFILYANYQQQASSVPVTANSQPVTSLVAPQPIVLPVRRSGALYKDGAYTSPVTDAYYGNLQVKAVIQNGKLADVMFLDYPKDRSTSIRINTQAMPILRSEAIQAQSANVDAVSGATQTSEAFNQSLSSVLLQAKL
ncbi:MAG: FMN-binding protein [Candidatus Vogelbacteria bacterium]|nr:FMN-binding protein [Candidatus Vogelbacteria bacterium]